MTLQEYERAALARRPNCKFCRARLVGPVDHYAHERGWVVDGFAERQWLYITCPKCEYAWALWKLGVAQ